MYFGDLNLHGHFDIFSLMETEVVPGNQSKLLHGHETIMVHGVQHPPSAEGVWDHE